MKLNKKVFAGALALAMGLGVAAPAVNSYAAKADSTMEIVEKEYRAAGEAWLKAYNQYEDAKAVEKDLDDKIEAAKKAVQEATNKEIDANKLDTKEEDKAIEEAKANLKKAQDDFDKENNKDDKDEYRINKLQKDLDEANKKLEEANKAKEAKDKENEKAKAEASKATEEAKEALNKAIQAKNNKKIKVEDEEKPLNEAISELEAKEGKARKDFKDQGANNNILEVMKKLNDVVLPDDGKVQDEEIKEKIEKQLKVNKEKLAGLKVVKEMMPESYKRYKDTIDTAIANAEKAIKAAEDYLGTKVSFLTVSFAADDKTGEEILKDLEDSEKELDDAMSQVEEDNKAKNEADEKEKEDEETEGTEEDEETEGTEEDDKPVVEEKEDVKPANNVKTGVAGVAGVGAVLAAASAAYVSSKRK